MEKFKTVLAHIGEYALSIIFLMAAYGEIVYNEATVDSALSLLFTDPIVTTIYAVWFSTMAIALLISKWFKHKRLHKHTLAAMYLTTVYTISLALAVFGFFEGAIIDDSIIGLVAALCWLRWKFKTEYIDPNKFKQDVINLR